MLAFLGFAAPAAAASDGHGAAPAKEKDVKAKDAAVSDVQASDIKPPDPDQPYFMVRTLERIQDRIAEGNSQAHGFQREFIAEIADKMLSSGEDIWQDPRNVRGAVVYVLSGGDPRVLKKLVANTQIPEFNTALLKGVIAYAEGKNREAQKALSDIDHRVFDSRTAGHVALAKAMVTAQDDPKKAMGFLDDARLLCPGTLVEEAALRRQVLLLSNTDNLQRFEMLAFQYLRRYPRSIYARNFSRTFAITIASGKYATDPQLTARLQKQIADLRPEVRRSLYMAIAEESVTRGRVELTRLSADQAAPLLPANSRDAVRLELYRAAALVVTKDYDFALGKLRMIDRSKLNLSDSQLLDNALALAQEVRQPPAVEGTVKQLPPLSSATQVKYGAIAEKSEALDKARNALGQADALLNKDRR